MRARCLLARGVAQALLARPRWRFWQQRPVFDEDDVERDLARIAAFYRSPGFYEATARSELAWDEERESVAVTFHVEEGPPVRVASRRIEIAPPLGDRPDEPSFRRGLPLVRGDVFSLDAYGAARRELLARAAEAGHPRADIEGGAEVDAATREARVDWRLEPARACASARCASRASTSTTRSWCAASSRSPKATPTRSRRCARRAIRSGRSVSSRR